jgi:hypothetical protein
MSTPAVQRRQRVAHLLCPVCRFNYVHFERASERGHGAQLRSTVVQASCESNHLFSILFDAQQDRVVVRSCTGA